MKTIRHNYLILALLLITAGSFAQKQKLNENHKVKSDVEIDIDGKHTNFIIETWDKNEVSVHAYLEGEELSKEESKRILEGWNLKTSVSPEAISIKSSGNTMNWEMDMSHLEEPLAKLPELLQPLMTDLVGPILANISDHPLPPDLANNLGDMKFDFEAYKKDGDKYLEKWEEKMESNFGKDFEQKMEKWAKNIEKNAEAFEKQHEKRMEVWGKQFEKDMEAWGEEFGKKMEVWGEEFGKRFEESMKNGGNKNMFNSHGGDSGAKRTVKLKIPADAILDLDIRHGELKLTNNIKNLKAELSHSKLQANRLSGKKTNIKASYTPIKVTNWDYGVLTTEFVKDCSLENITSIKLLSNSSDISIGEIKKTGILSGSFGKLDIKKLSPNFETLSISLENSDLKLSVPNTAFNFSFNGMQSQIKYPGEMKLKSTKSYDNEILNGYYLSGSGNSNITIKANFSDILIN
ncbi:hypothetical protein [Christiangramia salexigens]|uniref:Adhesin domain-containing protein n=1 Tax=Christiangramia salexigens TaxID=1913577 RepID=A0A1L3J4V7_9FLAO|nr:hypothetical protein [Christiangramia salexigens]APG60140.1 hypothetical protein LPB144_06795 [Christiangramia salexigens]